MNRSIFIGYEPREFSSFVIARASIDHYLTQPLPIFTLVLEDLQKSGLYTRPMEWRRSSADRPIMWDTLSDAAMSTEHANARFLVPRLAASGWAMFADCDVLARANIARIFDGLDPAKAVYCVQHDFKPPTGIKMDGQEQVLYARKNWSSVMIFNCSHPANRALTPAYFNTVPGRDLHRFAWLKDEEIGALDPSWNWLVGHSDKAIAPKLVHFTSGTPDMFGYEGVDYADEWRAWRDRLARGPQKIARAGVA